MGIFEDPGIFEVFREYGWIFVPIGLFLGLLGYRVYRLSLLLIGLLVGLGVGEWIGSITDNVLLFRILGAVAGVILGVVLHLLAKFSFFVIGMVGGFILSNFIFVQTGLALATPWELILKLITMLICGIFTMMLYKSLIIVFTSIVGIFLIYLPTIQFFPQNSANWSWILYAILLLVFIVVQTVSRKYHKDPVRKANR